jgi:transcription initiation factor TFIIIB Brf1 subunit/transcription initiation factor TFIIB
MSYYVKRKHVPPPYRCPNCGAGNACVETSERWGDREWTCRQCGAVIGYQEHARPRKPTPCSSEASVDEHGRAVAAAIFGAANA